MTHAGFEDAFYIPQEDIPQDVGYQWVTFTVMGSEDFDLTTSMKLKGWGYVPPDRHVSRFPKSEGKERIEVQGLVLMQASLEHLYNARKEDSDRASQLHADIDGSKDAWSRNEFEYYIKHIAVEERTSFRSDILPSPTNWKREKTKLKRLWKRFYWAFQSWCYGLTQREIDCALDGTIMYNRGESDCPDQGHKKPIGISGYAWRKHAMKKDGRYGR